MDFTFKLKGAFLGIEFSFKPEQVIQKLGEPELIEKYQYSTESPGEFDETYYYKNGLFRIVFSYENGVYNELSIFSKKLIINHYDMFALLKKEALEVVEELSNLNHNSALKATDKLDDLISEEYEFSDIGLTLWYEGNFLDEVCIYNPL